MVNLTHPELAEIRNETLPTASLDALKELRNRLCDSASSDYQLQSHQKFLRRVLSPDDPTRNLLMVHGTGVGKCHGRGTSVLMYDGSKKLVEDVDVGDILMGDDSTPRTVESLARGRDQMYRITGVKGDSYVVNSEHVLCLQHTSTRNVVTELTVKEFLKKSNKIQRNLKGYRTSVDFITKAVDFDPYILGVWLGDGSQRDPVITSQDAAILHYLRDFCQRNNSVLTFQSRYTYRVSAVSGECENVFLNFLKKYDLINNKHVPDDYKINSREIRLQVLAGLIDTDGYLINGTYEIIQKSEQLANDIVFLARSVGLATTTRLAEKSCIYKGERVSGLYYRTFISGDTDMIPVKILRKKASPRTQIKDVLRYGITVSGLGEDDYFGFTLNGNHRYVLGDFTVTHNSCTAIQIAEEYILRPEFQEKKVLVVAGPAVQSNFKTEIFDINRVSLDKTEALLSSKQCTGRRYLDMLLRIEADPKQWKVPETRIRLGTLADRIISEFYEFAGYSSFGAMINKKFLDLKPADAEKWVHDTFDNRLLIVDEAHNLREGSSEMKTVSTALETLVKTADGLVLVLLTATPMYDTHEEIIFYMNLFLWNDRRQPLNKKILPGEFLMADGSIKASKEQEFRDWAQRYVSYVKGENPFTFPFRLPAPELEGLPEPLTGFTGLEIGAATRTKYLTITASTVAGGQKKIIDGSTGKDEDEEARKALIIPTISVLPGNKPYGEVLRASGAQWQYTVEPFLTPEALPGVSAKFVTIIQQIEASKGVVLVYSNYVERGARLFAMALEEHGYTPVSGPNLLENAAYKGKSKGEYMLLSSEVSTPQTNALLALARSERNVNGEKVRVIVTTPRISEGVNFRYVRQVHLLDPWWNMSRIEQVIGRALRTCSHQALPFEEQNCSVYLHVLRSDTEHECFDEYTYRTKVEEKGVKIARVRRLLEESAMDCPMQTSLNTLPLDWKNLEVPQKRSEGAAEVKFVLKDMMAPVFSDGEPAQCRVKTSEPDEGYVRPLSTYFDVRDEVFNKLGKLFIDKPIWDRQELFSALKYQREVVVFLLQNAIRTGFKFKDSFGRPSLLQSRGDLYSLTPIENGTIVERTTQTPTRRDAPIETVVPEEPKQVGELPDLAKQVAELNFKDTSLVEATPPEGADAKARAKIRDANKKVQEQAQLVDQFSQRIKVDFAAVLPGYVFDRLSREDKLAYLRSPAATTLPFADRLRVPGTEILVMGKDDYDPADPIGDDRTAVQEWEKALNDRYAVDNDKMIGTMKDGKFLIGKFEEKEGVFKRIHGVKRDVPIVCGTGSNTTEQVKKLAKYTDIRQRGIPDIPKKCTWTQCDIMELLAREQNNIVWYTPEEMDVLTKLKTKTKAKNNE
jgi:hypothetical protein